MKLSKRERILILILSFVALGYLVYTFGVSKLDDRLRVAEADYNQKKELYEIMNEKINMKDEYMNQIDVAASDTKGISEKLLSIIEQEQVLVFLNSYLQKCYVQTDSLVFSDVEDIDFVIPSEESGDGIANGNVVSAQMMDVNISFKATCKNLMKFIDEMQNNKVEIVITQLDILKIEGDQMQGIITVRFYAVPKATDENTGNAENKEWIWKDVFIKAGDYNPFSR